MSDDEWNITSPSQRNGNNRGNHGLATAVGRRPRSLGASIPTNNANNNSSRRSSINNKSLRAARMPVRAEPFKLCSIDQWNAYIATFPKLRQNPSPSRRASVPAMKASATDSTQTGHSPSARVPSPVPTQPTLTQSEVSLVNLTSDESGPSLAQNPPPPALPPVAQELIDIDFTYKDEIKKENALVNLEVDDFLALAASPTFVFGSLRELEGLTTFEVTSPTRSNSDQGQGQDQSPPMTLPQCQRQQPQELPAILQQLLEPKIPEEEQERVKAKDEKPIKKQMCKQETQPPDGRNGSKGRDSTLFKDITWDLYELELRKGSSRVKHASPTLLPPATDCYTIEFEQLEMTKVQLELVRLL